MLASLTISIIFAIVPSLYSFVTSTSREESKFTNPEVISSPTSREIGANSPEIFDVSTFDTPFIIFPSKGTFSPGLIIILSPTETFIGSTLIISPSFNKLAKSGFNFKASSIDFFEESTALS